MRKVLLLGLGLLIAGGFWFGEAGLFQYRLWRARRALKQRDAEQALVWLLSAERLDTEHGETHFWMARAHRRLGHFDLVKPHLERALRLGYNVERLQREKWLTLAQTGRLAEADPHLATLLSNPGDDGPEICEAFVRGYFEMYPYRRGMALRLLDGWQADYPDDPQPHFFRGLFSEHDSQWEQATVSYRRALQLAPGRYDLRLRLARVLREQYQYTLAEKHYRACLEKQPDEPQALVGWGRCLQAQGELKRARDVFSRLLEHMPENFEARLALGELQLAAHQPLQALRYLEPAAREKPYDLRVRHALATALQETGDSERAREHFEFAKAGLAALFRVRTLLNRVAADPGNVELRYEIGMAQLQYAKPPTGEIWLQSVLDLQPDYRPAHAALADYYSQQGHTAMAAKHRLLAESPQK